MVSSLHRVRKWCSTNQVARYLCTLAAAEQLYDAIYQWEQIGSITISSTSLPFFKDVYSSAATGNYASSSSTFNNIISAVSAYADSYMSNAQKYTPSNGALAEQYLRSNGAPASARDLTWSYAALITANNARKNTMPASWGASSARLPSTCSRGSATGPCSTATNTNWDNPGAPCATPSTTRVTFNVLENTSFGETVYIVGSISQLGSWNTDNAAEMSATRYTNNNPLWFATVNLPTGTSFDYKYIKKSQNGGSVTYEGGADRRYTVPGSCAGTATQNDSWK